MRSHSAAQAAVWEPQTIRRSRPRHRSPCCRQQWILLYKNINEARLSTGHTQQDLVNLVTLYAEVAKLYV